MARRASTTQAGKGGRKIPSARIILSTDYWGGVSFIFCFILTAATLVAFLAGKTAAPVLTQMMPWLLPMGYGWAFLTVRKVRQTFRKGEVVEGTISSVRRERKSTTVDYYYQVGSSSHERSFRAMPSSVPKSMSAGDAVEVVVDPQNPSGGLVVPIFRLTGVFGS
ncbi:MAG: DUF3592 domain-containing protein [Chromatiales bacterium]|jgi:hypothetical protein|nr:DUF3592 domain-containing protein [Chromatiales bacterium]